MNLAGTVWKLLVDNSVFDGVRNVDVQTLAEPNTWREADVLRAGGDSHSVCNLGVAGAGRGAVVQRKRPARGAGDKHTEQLAAADFDLGVSVALSVKCHFNTP